jgi:uncharacterized glyoxalase superfamily protein PhnB
MPDELRPNLFPALRYADADAAVAFLTGAFGFEEKEVHRGEDGSVADAVVPDPVWAEANGVSVMNTPTVR